MPYRKTPPGATAALALSDGAIFWGKGIGAPAKKTGEVCFNTSITGYQEILTDPSYAGQIVTFTFPHIGNVGTNAEDIETITPAVRGLVLRADITAPSNFRSTRSLDACRSPALKEVQCDGSDELKEGCECVYGSVVYVRVNM